MKRGNRLTAAWMAFVFIKLSVGPLPFARAEFPNPVQRLGRLQGFGWGDGYHTCSDAKLRIGADLPPKYYMQGHRPKGHPVRDRVRQIGSTFYDHFDAANGRPSCRGGCDAPPRMQNTGPFPADEPMTAQQPMSAQQPITAQQPMLADEPTWPAPGVSPTMEPQRRLPVQPEAAAGRTPPMHAVTPPRNARQQPTSRIGVPDQTLDLPAAEPTRPDESTTINPPLTGWQPDTRQQNDRVASAKPRPTRPAPPEHVTSRSIKLITARPQPIRVQQRSPAIVAVSETPNRVATSLPPTETSTETSAETSPRAYKLPPVDPSEVASYSAPPVLSTTPTASLTPGGITPIHPLKRTEVAAPSPTENVVITEELVTDIESAMPRGLSMPLDAVIPTEIAHRRPFTTVPEVDAAEASRPSESVPDANRRPSFFGAAEAVVSDNSIPTQTSIPSYAREAPAPPATPTVVAEAEKPRPARLGAFSDESSTSDAGSLVVRPHRLGAAGWGDRDVSGSEHSTDSPMLEMATRPDEGSGGVIRQPSLRR